MKERKIVSKRVVVNVVKRTERKTAARVSRRVASDSRAAGNTIASRVTEEYIGRLAGGATIVEHRTESIIASENVSINSATRPVYACMKITKLLITTAIN